MLPDARLQVGPVAPLVETQGCSTACRRDALPVRPAYPPDTHVPPRARAWHACHRPGQCV